MHHIMFTLISHGSLQLSRNVFSSSWETGKLETWQTAPL